MLPAALLEIFPKDTMAKLGGWAQLCKVDLELALLKMKLPDHPWVGLTVTFPFPEVGKGKIVKCLTHPRGTLLFDVFFEEPVPPMNSWGPGDGRPGGCEVVLVNRPDYHQQWHRFDGRELLAIINGDWAPRTR